MNLFGQTGSNNYINALKQTVGATFSRVEDWSGHFTDRYSYQVSDSENYPFEQHHVLRNDISDLGTIPESPTVDFPITLQVEFVWGRIYKNLGLTGGAPATYTVDGDTYELADETKYKLEAGLYLIPEGAEFDCQGVTQSYLDLLALTDLREFVLVYLPDDLENPSSFARRAAFPFDGYYYFGKLNQTVDTETNCMLNESLLFKPDGSYKSQLLNSQWDATPVTVPSQEMFFTHLIGNQNGANPRMDFWFEGKRLTIPMSAIGLDHTPAEITFINIQE